MPDACRCYIAAELGANHNGDPRIARQMIAAAAKCGVDAVKVQLRDLAAHPEWAGRIYTGPSSYGGTYLEHRRALELDRSELIDLADHAHALGLEVGASLWDESTIEVAFAMRCDWLKAPSACITDDSVMKTLEWAARWRGVPVVISIGMSTEAEVVHAIDGYDWPEGDRLTILSCTSAYPCANEDIHLDVLLLLQERWGHRARIGYSGHWAGIQVDAAAVALGARWAERHFTLNRTWRGTDHAASLEPHGMELLVRDIHVVEAARGRRRICVKPCEEAARAKLRRGVA